jgi:hypothetical protein
LNKTERKDGINASAGSCVKESVLILKGFLPTSPENALGQRAALHDIEVERDKRSVDDVQQLPGYRVEFSAGFTFK